MPTTGIRSPAPNTQPIYPREPLVWFANLTTQVTGYNPGADPALVPPVKLGNAGDNGAILEHVTMQSIYEVPTTGGGGTGGGSTGGGGTGGGNPADGDFGLGTTIAQCSLRFFSRRFGTNELQFVIEIGLFHDRRIQTWRWGYFPILPDPQVALRLAPNEELYVSLKRAVPAPGLIVSLRGGYY
jgi:hypothetical protein